MPRGRLLHLLMPVAGLSAASALLIQRSSEGSGNSECAPSGRQCKYVVIGSEGVAGKSAMAVLRQHAARSRDVMGIDPNAPDVESRHCVESLDCSRRQLTLSDGSVVNFEQVLIATGRGIPRSDRDRKGEKAVRLGELEGSIDPVLFRRKHAVFIDDPFVVEGLVKKVSRGEHVTILGGSTMDTRVIEVALKLASAGRRAGFDNVVSIVCPSLGIMSQQLPRYLSMALNRRLNTLGVEVIRYAQVRYVSGIDAIVPVEPGEDDDYEDEDEDNDNAEKFGRSKYGKVALFCSHTYDSLNTTSFESDTVVLIGTSASVIDYAEDKSKPLHFGLKAGLEGGTVGGIVCNRSLQAAAGIWLAGDVANLDLGSSSLGRGCWSGIQHAQETGRVAALNMLGGSHLYDSVPIDHLVCAAEPFLGGSDRGDARDDGGGAEAKAKQVSTAENSPAGIYLGGARREDDNLMSLCFVGHCSAAQDSYGFWWARRLTPGLRGAAPAETNAVGDVSGVKAAAAAKSNRKSGSHNSSEVGEVDAEVPSPARGSAESKDKGKGIAGVVQEQFLGYFGLSSRESKEAPEDTHAPMTARGRKAVVRVLPTTTTTTTTSSSSSSSSRSQEHAKRPRGPSGPNQRHGQRLDRGTSSREGPRSVKRVPRVAPLGAGMVVYLSPSGTITGVLLAGLAPSHSCSASSEAGLAYRELQEHIRRLIGTKISPYFEEGTPSARPPSSSAPQQQAAFLFGNPSGAGRYVSVSSQLESMIARALWGYDSRLRASSDLAPSGNRPAETGSRPSLRTAKGSLELQRSLAALITDSRGTKVTPVPALREKLASGMAHSSSKDRIQAAYSSAMRNSEIRATWNGHSEK